MGRAETITVSAEENIYIRHYFILDNETYRHAMTLASEDLGYERSWLSKNLHDPERAPMRDKWIEMGEKLFPNSGGFSGEVLEVRSPEKSDKSIAKTISDRDFYIILKAQEERELAKRRKGTKTRHGTRAIRILDIFQYVEE